jgi:hypothetical protein
MDDDVLPVGGAVNVGFDAEVLLSVTGSHKGGAGIFLFQTAQTTVRNHFNIFAVDFNGVHVNFFAFNKIFLP